MDGWRERGPEFKRSLLATPASVGLARDLTEVLPRPGESVAVIGCGTSWFMAAAYAGLREAADHRLQI